MALLEAFHIAYCIPNPPTVSVKQAIIIYHLPLLLLSFTIVLSPKHALYSSSAYIPLVPTEITALTYFVDWTRRHYNYSKH